MTGGERISLSVPGWERPEDALGFGATLAALGNARAYEFDFAKVSFVPPGWLLSIGNALRTFRSERPNSTRRAVNFKHLTYPAHLGFFKYVGIQFGQAPAEAAGSNTYFPITEVNVSGLKQLALQKFLPVGEIIEEAATELARILTQSHDGEAVETLTYSIREIVRNVAEHSGASSYTIAAQYWPTATCAELAISDSGCGIPASLKENPKLDIESDSEALKLALLPGISSKAWRRNRSGDAWANSGYGLFMTHRLCSLDGEFTLMSGNSGVRSIGGEFENLTCHAPGTTVILRINTAKVASLTKRLAEFRDEGGKLAKLVGGANRLGPSLASQILRPTQR